MPQLNNVTQSEEPFNKEFFKNLTVLYVEDDEVVNSKLKNIFESLFFKVICCFNGIEAFKKFKNSLDTNKKIDIIISDITMPKMDGIELLQKIRNYDKYIPFIFTTAHLDCKYTMESIKQGISNYIIKPINVQELICNIQKTCQERFEQISINNSNKELTKQNKDLETQVEVEITKSKEQEKVIYQYSKMATMGEMFSNITHQWKQPLSAISINASGLQFQKEINNLSDKSFEEGMERIIDNTIYLSQTIDDFHNFLKPDNKRSSFDLKNCIIKSVELIIPLLENNNIKEFINLNSIDVNGIKGEFIQVILNLLNNAKDVLVENNIKNERFIFIDSIIKEDKIILSLKDNGGGISQENLNNIFEQYFTTKDTQGSGIGLYMSKEIIESHMSGKLFVHNVEFTHNDKIYKGAQFNIELPLNH